MPFSQELHNAINNRIERVRSQGQNLVPSHREALERGDEAETEILFQEVNTRLSQLQYVVDTGKRQQVDIFSDPEVVRAFQETIDDMCSQLKVDKGDFFRSQGDIIPSALKQFFQE